MYHHAYIDVHDRHLELLQPRRVDGAEQPVMIVTDQAWPSVGRPGEWVVADIARGGPLKYARDRREAFQMMLDRLQAAAHPEP